MKKSLGFTLIELLVTMAIMATLATLAAPSVAGLVQSNNVSSAVNTFLGALRYARSEALRRGATVVVCRSAAPDNTPPACTATAGSDSTTDWSTGWLVFENRDSDADNYDSNTDKLLRVQTSLGNTYGTAGSTDTFKFTPLGRMQGAASSVTFGKDIAARTRKVSVSMTGRPSLSTPSNSD